jgi:hypothetical protein
VSLKKQVWHLNYQDAIAIGKLFLDGELYCERMIALGGPQVKEPRLVKTCSAPALMNCWQMNFRRGKPGYFRLGPQRRACPWAPRFPWPLSSAGERGKEGREKSCSAG